MFVVLIVSDSSVVPNGTDGAKETDESEVIDVHDVPDESIKPTRWEAAMGVTDCYRSKQSK